MPADLEQQLPRFAEGLDREASAISVDEILSRGTVAVDVDRLEGPLSDRARRVNGVTWDDAMPGHNRLGDRDAWIDVASTSAERPTRRRVALRFVSAAAAAAVLVVALATVERIGDESDPADVPLSTVPTPPPSTVPAAPTTMVEQPMSSGMWPQSTLEEVQAAQQFADAGDPDYTWQLEPELVSMEYEGSGQVELVDRFLREVLGWEASIFHPTEAGTARAGEYVDLVDQRYLRCAPGRTNPMYPPGPEPETDEETVALLRRGDLCAPTIDDLTYESVSLDLTQPVGQGSDRIWVVNQWELTATYTQADPAVVEAQGTQGLQEFLAARLAGDGADDHVEVYDDTDVPLLYASTSGAPYERYEIESVGRPRWPSGSTTFSVRLFTDGDTTVVEQQFRWVPSRGLWLDNRPTTENGQPIARSVTSSDGEVTLAVPDTWDGYLAGETWLKQQDQDMWIGSLSRREDLLGPNERIELVDPVAYDAWCADNGGSPLLTAPANAAAIAEQLIADPNFETTAPVAARIGGVEAVSIDVSLAPGGKACGIGMIDIPRWIHTIGWDPGWRLRLYLVDLPEGMSVETLAITVVAPDDRFDDVIAETAPIIESIEFHPG